MLTMTSIANPARRPSDAEWAAHLPRICELYYGLRYTLEDTQRVIQQETGFYATLRMYKDRIRNMAVHPKKICMQKYQAMSIVAEDFQHRGIGVHFIGPSGFQVFKRTPAQITKQLRRPHTLQPITLEQAKEVLQQSSIQAVVDHAAMVPPPGETNAPASVPDHHPGGTMATPASLPYGSETSTGFNVHPPPPFSDERLDVPQLPAVRTGHDLPHQRPAWNHPADAGEASLPPLHGQPLFSAGLSFPSQPLVLPPKLDCLSLAGVNLVPERLQQPRLTDEAGDSYDFVADFDALSVARPNTPKPNATTNPGTHRMLPPPSSLQRRRLAVEFAAPFFLACFAPAHAREEFTFSRSAAMERFKYILTANPENQYVLPLLNWMSTVLSANDKPDLLKDFASECCQVLDTCRDYGFPLSTPFRYMLAFCNEDSQSQELYAAQFAQGTETLIHLYGADHPNVLVNEYYHAWHLMMHPSGWTAAKSILETCLVKSEKVMGRRDLMTINCLVVLGRGCAENGLDAQAQAIFLDVLERFTEPAHPLRAYYLLIVDRLAAAEARLGNLASAVRLFRQVYDGRLTLLSASSTDTKAAMCSLVRALNMYGQPDEAARVQQHYDQEFEMLWRREAQPPEAASSMSTTSSEQSSPQLSWMSSSRL